MPLNPPLLAPAAARADAAAWGRVAIKWVSSLADLQAYGACLHLLDPAARPDAVCVDDVGGLPVGGEEAPAVPPGGPEGAPPPPPPPPRPPPDRRAREQALMRALALLADGVGGGWRGQEEGSGGGGGAVAEQWHRPGGGRPGRLVLAVRTDGGQGGGGAPSAASPAAPLFLLQRWAPLVLASAPGPAGFEFGSMAGGPRAVFRVSGREGLAADGVVIG